VLDAIDKYGSSAAFQWKFLVHKSYEHCPHAPHSHLSHERKGLASRRLEIPTPSARLALRLLFSSECVKNGKVLIAGGRTTAILRTQRKSLTRSMGAVRSTPTLTLLPNATLLISGGVDIFSGPDAPEFTVLASCELYAPASHAAQFTGSLPTPRTGHTSTLLKNGAVLVVGGAGGAGNTLASAELCQ
jgi:hypothetical protein